MFYRLVYNIPSHLNGLIWSEVSCYNNAKKLVLKIQDYCMNLPNYGANRNYNSLFKLADIN